MLRRWIRSMSDCWIEIETRSYFSIKVGLLPLLVGEHSTLMPHSLGFRRQWSTYMSIYLFTKLSALLIVAVVNPSNCLFRPSTSSIRAQLGSNITLPVVNLDTTTPDPVITTLKTILTSWSTHISHITLTRQILLLCSTILWFAIQCFYAPFLDPVSNASEWVSRANYVVTAVLALVVQAGAGGKFVEEMLEGWGLYAVYVVTYGMSFYFTVIGMGVGRRGVKCESPFGRFWC